MGRAEEEEKVQTDRGPTIEQGAEEEEKEREQEASFLSSTDLIHKLWERSGRAILQTAAHEMYCKSLDKAPLFSPLSPLSMCRWGSGPPIWPPLGRISSHK